jgi:hypothetical protein
MLEAQRDRQRTTRLARSQIELNNLQLHSSIFGSGLASTAGHGIDAKHIQIIREQPN